MFPTRPTTLATKAPLRQQGPSLPSPMRPTPPWPRSNTITATLARNFGASTVCARPTIRHLHGSKPSSHHRHDRKLSNRPGLEEFHVQPGNRRDARKTRRRDAKVSPLTVEAVEAALLPSVPYPCSIKTCKFAAGRTHACASVVGAVRVCLLARGG